MPALTVLVISRPDAPHLALLKKLPPSTTVVVGNEAGAFNGIAARADVLVNGSHHSGVLKEVWKMAPNVRWVHSLSAGVESIVFPELGASPVPLTNAAGVYAPSLAEFAMLGILYFAKDIARMNRAKAASKWEQFLVEEIRYSTLGIVGYGGIGRETARRAKAFGMKVLAMRRKPATPDENVDEFFTQDRMRDLITRSDYLLVSAPLTPDTRGMIGASEIAAMKPSAVLMNVARGPVIHEAAMIEALREQRIRGAVLDVFDEEPLPADNPLWKLDNVLLSPHCADQTATWQHDSMNFFLENFERFSKGEPLRNVVDKSAGY